MTVSDHQVIIDGNGLCTRCANINWEGLAHTIEHFPLRRPAPDQRLHVFHLDTTVKETGDALLKSPCRFCRLLGSACTIHSLVTPGQLDCVHTASSMISIEMESMVSALAITLDNVPKASRVFFREYGSITAVDFDQVTSDLRACEYGHDGCTPDRLADLPGFRLIDCRTKIIVPAQSTLDIEDQGHVSTVATYQYVALSYVWGPKPDESRISQSGSWDNLPRTIDDSISVCRALGYRYLWVDRYVSSNAYSSRVVPGSNHSSVSIRRIQQKRLFKSQTWEGSTRQHNLLSSHQSVKTHRMACRDLPSTTRKSLLYTRESDDLQLCYVH